jgi:hypothetical protein
LQTYVDGSDEKNLLRSAANLAKAVFPDFGESEGTNGEKLSELEFTPH